MSLARDIFLPRRCTCVGHILDHRLPRVLTIPSRPGPQGGRVTVPCSRSSLRVQQRLMVRMCACTFVPFTLSGVCHHSVQVVVLTTVLSVCIYVYTQLDVQPGLPHSRNTQVDPQGCCWLKSTQFPAPRATLHFALVGRPFSSLFRRGRCRN